MIKVAPPKGWVPPAPAPDESKLQTPVGAPGAAGVTDSNFDFDDIETLLAKPDQIASAKQATSQTSKDSPRSKQAASAKTQPPKRTSAQTVAPRQKKRASAKTSDDGADTAASDSLADDSQPMLPNQNWESGKSKSQKTRLRILAAILGLILFSGFIFAMISSFRGRSPKNVSQKQSQPADAADDVQPDAPIANDVESVETALDTQPNSNTEETIDKANPDPALPNDAATGTLANPESDPDSSLDSDTEGSPIDSTDASATQPPPDLPVGTFAGKTEPTTDDRQRQGPFLPSRFRNSENEGPDVAPDRSSKQPGIGIVNKIEKQMGDLSGLLQESGASLSELRDATVEASGTSLAGIPKYVIEKPGPIKPDLGRLNLNVGGLLFDETPLPVVVRELSLISGIPITIDARTLEAAGKKINQPISATIKDTDLDSAMNQILAPLGITKQTDSVGLKFTVASSLEFKEATYSVAKFAGLDEENKKSFLSYIQAMIEPEIWVRAEDPATIQLQGNDIVARCPAEVHAQIDRLISKLLAANALTSDPTDAAAINQTLTRSGAILSKLESPIQNQHTIRTPIGLFLTKLQSKTGVTVIVDWENLSKQDWNPLTLIPGNIDEPTAGDTLRQLAQSMNLSVVAVDSDTVLLTTPDQAAIARDIEVYPVAKLLAGKFDEDRLKEAFATTLGYELRNEKYVYDSSCQCFIVAASQAKQRQVAALLKELEGI